jgi:hypothetical protein
MATSASSVPNHYEVLGLSPAASQQEINRAFAREMGMFGARPVVAAARIGLAYEVLRDPARRRAYDSALGLTAEPERSPWMMAATVRVGRPAFDNVPLPVASPEPQPQPEPRADPRLASIVASLRELAKADAAQVAVEVKPDTEERPRAEQQPRPERRVQPEARPPAEKPPRVQDSPPAAVEPSLEQLLTRSWEERESAREAKFLPDGWSRIAWTIGGFVIAAGIIGAVGGMSLKGSEQQLPGATMPLPSPTPHPNLAAAAPVAFAERSDAAAQEPVHADVSSAPVTHVVAPERRIAATAAPLAATQPVGSTPAPSEPEVTANDPLAPQPAAAQPVAASMPLPNRVIARTIQRIGYSCGGVASTAAIDGEAGAFTVTCTSGQAYKATPVRGRYHFRRLGNR